MMLMRWTVILLSLLCLGNANKSEAADLKPLFLVYVPGAGADYLATKRHFQPWDRELSPLARWNQEATQVLQVSAGYGIDLYLQRREAEAMERYNRGGHDNHYRRSKNYAKAKWAWRGFYIGAKVIAVFITAREK